MAYGTAYSIQLKYTNPEIKKKIYHLQKSKSAYNKFQNEIQKILQRIDDSMSHWREDTEISRINSLKSTENTYISKDLYDILDLSQYIYKISKGAFDPSHARLFAVWGFSSPHLQKKQGKITAHQIPGTNMLETAKQEGGMENVKLLDLGKNKYALQKLKKNLAFDLSAVAKGYAVDALSSFLKQEGFHTHLVEIGGEIKVSSNDNKQEWHIGIEKPLYNYKREVYRTVLLKNSAIASSGSYRNFLSFGQKSYSHVVSPHTKKALSTGNALQSVSVIGKSCAKADALATTLLLMSIKEGRALIEKEKGYEAMWIEKDNKKYKTTTSSNMHSFLKI